MRTRIQQLIGYKLHALDGEIGKVKDFYFDDQHWTIRYLIADTGNWLTGRQALISPYALEAVSREERHVSLNLTKAQIENSPSLETDKPVSRQFEDAYYGYYGWPTYWGGPYVWGAFPFPALKRNQGNEFPPQIKAWNPHLRSAHEVNGYHIQAKDGEIGHVADFIIDDETWTIRYLVIDTKNWWPGEKVLVSTQWIERVSWTESKVFINLTRDTIKLSPEFTEASKLTREYETGLHLHYNRQGYWVNEMAVVEHD